MSYIEISSRTYLSLNCNYYFFSQAPPGEIVTVTADSYYLHPNGTGQTIPFGSHTIDVINTADNYSDIVCLHVKCPEIMYNLLDQENVTEQVVFVNVTINPPEGYTCQSQ